MTLDITLQSQFSHTCSVLIGLKWDLKFEVLIFGFSIQSHRILMILFSITTMVLSAIAMIMPIPLIALCCNINRMLHLEEFLLNLQFNWVSPRHFEVCWEAPSISSICCYFRLWARGVLINWDFSLPSVLIHIITFHWLHHNQLLGSPIACIHIVWTCIPVSTVWQTVTKMLSKPQP